MKLILPLTEQNCANLVKHIKVWTVVHLIWQD